MKRFKHALRWWPALLVLILVAGGVGIGTKWLPIGASETADLTQVFMVERGNLVAAVSPTGEVYAPRQVELSFDVSKIQLIELNVTPGQKVRAGEVLARIDSAALERAVLQAEADLTVAQDNLEKTQNPYTELDLIQARLSVDQAEIALEEAKESLEEARDPYTELDLIQARQTVSQTEIALEEAKENLATVLNPDTGPAWAAVQDATAALEIARSQLTVTENETNNAAKIRTLESEMIWYRNNYWKAVEKFEKGEINKQKLDWEYLNLVSAEEKLLVAQTNADISLTNARNKVTQAEQTLLDAQKNLAALQGGPDAMELLQAEVQITQAEYDLAEALESLAEIEAGPDPKEVARAEVQVTQAEYNLAKARETMAEVEAGPDPKEIELAQAKVVSAQTALEEAQAALAAATMIAPFDGTVISVGAEVGDLVSSNNVVVALTDLSNLRVLAIVDETDIGLMEIGHEAEITFDAFPGHRFSGQVLEVPLQGSLVQNVLTYEVPVSLEGAAGVALKPGMTANLKIVVGRRQNALLVPAMAVQQGEEGNVVLVQDTPLGPGVATPVQVGLSDGMYVEVVSGLIEGDRVVVEYQAVQEQAGGLMGVRIPAMPGAGRMRRP
jgi:RND family efflux transporter MFP subunit